MLQTKMILMFIKKITDFPNKKTSYTCQKKNSFTKEKMSYTFPKKQFPKQNI